MHLRIFVIILLGACAARLCAGVPKCHLNLDECANFCPDDCPNGYCSLSRQRCECRKDFIWQAGVCRRSCSANDTCGPHAECTEENVCRCSIGYRELGDACVPHCSKGCQEHAKCIAPDVCQCVVGFHRVAEGVCVHEDCFEELDLLVIRGMVACKLLNPLFVCVLSLLVCVLLIVGFLLFHIYQCSKRKCRQCIGEEYILT